MRELKRIPAGEMRHKVTILEHKIDAATTGYDSYGQVTSSTTGWITTLTRRAKIEQLTGAEGIHVRQIYPTATHRVTIDYSSTLDSTGGYRRMVQFGSRRLFITGIENPDFENRQLHLMCGEER